jgi:uncharacterized membrane protein
MSLLVKVLFALLFALYPFIIFFGLNQFNFGQLALIVSIMALARIVWLKLFVKPGHSAETFNVNSGAIFTALLLLLFAVMTAFTDQILWLKLYPIAVSLTFFLIFASSLSTDKCMIQRFAEIREKNIDAQKQRYMIQLTKVWCGFFIFNILASLFTLLFTSMEVWTFYNGLVSYLLMGTLVVFELIYRHFVVIPKAL